MSKPIPQPPALPFLGNAFTIRPDNRHHDIKLLFEKYGEIFKINVFGKEIYFIGSNRLSEQVCNEALFEKSIFTQLEENRYMVGDGLFTAHTDEPNWGIAHRILTPCFGPLALKDMFDGMYDIASQLISKWARMGEKHVINAPEDYTRLTLDTIALCAMDKRFNSFYSETMSPFIQSMISWLTTVNLRSSRSKVQNMLDRRTQRLMAYDRTVMRETAQECIDNRREHPTDRKDLLNAMLYGKDPKTGQGMSDENIMNNLITFMVAGHETTSGLISFATYQLVKNPHTLQKAQAEVDQVIGKGPVRYEHMSKLPYLEAVMRESLRLNPTAPVFGMKPLSTEEPTPVGDYLIPADGICLVWLNQIGRDPEIFGEDAAVFKPERMMGENFKRLPASAWRVFGAGQRSCIGRGFAWQEAMLCLSMVLQNFNLQINDPSYDLKVKVTLTAKPDEFFIRARLREGVDALQIEKRMFTNGGSDNLVNGHSNELPSAEATSDRPLTILYGSNAGTCEGLAQALASNAKNHGYKPHVTTLNDAVENFPLEQPVVVVTASYEGLPTENATLFVEWLKKSALNRFSGAKVGVFGVGHKDWIATYQKIPTLIETLLTERGAATILPMGGTNVQDNTITDDFDAWTTKLWEALGTTSKSNEQVEGLDMKISTNARSDHLRQFVQNAVVVENKLLSPEGAAEKRHIEFKLPSDTTYEAGDYLAILPLNHVQTISRVLRRFGLPWDATMTLKKGSHSTIPTEVELPISNVLAAYVELKTPVTKRAIQIIEQYASKTRELANGSIVQSTSDKQNTTAPVSILDLIESDPSNEIPFSVFLSLLPPLRIRQYSISSSPVSDSTTASITFAKYDNVATKHLGVATSYLAELRPGSTVQLAIKKSHPAFHLPNDDNTPVIMTCAGTGVAPFRGFVQERAVKIAAGRQLAPAVLFIGCRGPSTGDDVHADEFRKWEKDGVVKVLYAYSKESEKTEDCKYVQERIWKERELVKELFMKGARVYVCGSGKVGKSIDNVAVKIAADMQANGDGEAVKQLREKVEWRLGRALEGELEEQELREWWSRCRGERFAVDVFD